MNIEVVPLDMSDDVTIPTVNLLRALQVDKLPAVRADGFVVQGMEAFGWAEARSGSLSTMKGHTLCTALLLEHVRPPSTRTLSNWLQQEFEK